MEFEATFQQKQDQVSIKEFVRKEIIPNADLYDREERTPRELIQKMAQQGFATRRVRQPSSTPCSSHSSPAPSSSP